MMRTPLTLRAAGLALVVGVCLVGRGDTAAPDGLPGFPSVVVWAWERPEDLRFLHPTEVGVAFLAGTLNLRGDGVDFYPRRQPLRIPDETRMMAVVRIETSRRDPSTFSARHRDQAVEWILRAATARGVEAVQVDFDAVGSERSFYRELLQELRRRMPKRLGLSITALASWCLGDSWIPPALVDEAVPMLFDMGADHVSITELLRSGGDFRVPVCRGALGISTYDRPPRLQGGRRLYLFHNGAWNEEALARILAEVQQ